jgi:HAD superfamily hydrolase (TIGR01509 family)
VDAELVIFDCDGVLVDSEPVANRVFAEELARLGLEMGYREICERFVGLSMARCMEIVGQRLGREVPSDFLERLQSRTFEMFRRGLQPVPGVQEALRGIDVPVCVASSGEHEKMRLTLGLTGLLPRFEGRLFSATEVPRGKPHPDLFLYAAKRMGASPRACIVVEDSPPGVAAARAAGMRALGYAGRENAGRLAAAGALVFDDMRELPGLVKGAARPARHGGSGGGRKA